MALHVEFYSDAVLHPSETKEAGRPIYKDVEMVRIQIPGDKKRIVVAPANEMSYDSDKGVQLNYKDRFPDHYKAFKETGEMFVSGSPLSVLGLAPAKLAEFKGLNIHTVEQLAELNDRDIKNMGMGARAFVDQAKAYLDNTGSHAEVAKLQAQIAELQAQVGGAKPEAKAATSDMFEGFEDDDLRNMISDAGGEVPRKNASRASLIEELEKLTEKAA